MSLVLRLQKNSALTNAEMDGNFVYLSEQIENIRSSTDLLADVTIPALATSTTTSLAQKQPLNAKLTSLASVAANGIVSYAGDVATTRTIVAGSSNIVVTNGTGQSGNPTVDIGDAVTTATKTQTLTNKTISGDVNTISNISLTASVSGVLPIANGGTGSNTASAARIALGALPKPTSDGIVVRTGNDTSINRQIDVSGSGISVTNKDGITGNPTITITSATANTANSLVYRDASGNFSAGTIAATLNGNCLGNAATVTNGVYVNQTYDNPTWINSLAGSKVTDIPNSSLINNSFILNGNVVRLGDSITFPTDIQPRASTNTANTIVLRNASGNFSAGIITASLTGNVTGNVAGNVVGNLTGNVIGNVTGNVTGSASLNVLKSGDTMTGYLTLHADPVNLTHAATKRYVDSRIPTYIFTSGASNTVDWTDSIYWNDRNYFDVFPPAGKSMGNLVAFIPSIRAIHFAGRVDGNDSIRCSYEYFGDRIRVYVQNTEQRSTPAANWLAVWS